MVPDKHKTDSEIELAIKEHKHASGAILHSWKLTKGKTVLIGDGRPRSPNVARRLHHLREDFRALVEKTKGGYRWVLPRRVGFGTPITSPRIFKTHEAALKALIEAALAIEEVNTGAE